jgi:hypothetical protein
MVVVHAWLVKQVHVLVLAQEVNLSRPGVVIFQRELLGRGGKAVNRVHHTRIDNLPGGIIAPFEGANTARGEMPVVVQCPQRGSTDEFGIPATI